MKSTPQNNPPVVFVNNIACKAKLTEGRVYRVERKVGQFYIILSDVARFVKVHSERFRLA